MFLFSCHIEAGQLWLWRFCEIIFRKKLFTMRSMAHKSSAISLEDTCGQLPRHHGLRYRWACKDAQLYCSEGWWQTYRNWVKKFPLLLHRWLFYMENVSDDRVSLQTSCSSPWLLMVGLLWGMNPTHTSWLRYFLAYPNIKIIIRKEYF